MLPWVRTKKELVLKTFLFGIYRVGFRSPATGREGVFDALETRDWVNVVAVTPERETLLVRQFRFGTATLSLEIPAGTIEEGKTPRETAERELAEETGGRAAKLIELGWSHPNPAFLNNRCHHFLALDVRIVEPTKFDEHEEIELVRVPLAELDRLIASGEITHALSIVSWHLAKPWLP